MAYSYEFKNNVLSRLMAKELTIAQAGEIYGVSQTSLRKWYNRALREAGAGADMMNCRTGVRERMTRLKLPKGINYLKAYEAVTARHLLSDTDFGAYCRRNGILAGSVAQWELWFKTHPEACDIGELREERQLRLQAQQESKAKSRELNRKEKALAETATMLVLAKKAQAIWGNKEN